MPRLTCGNWQVGRGRVLAGVVLVHAHGQPLAAHPRPCAAQPWGARAVGRRGVLGGGAAVRARSVHVGAGGGRPGAAGFADGGLKQGSGHVGRVWVLSHASITRA